MPNIIEVVLQSADQGVSAALGAASSGLGVIGNVAQTALGVLTGGLMRDALDNLANMGKQALSMASEFQDTTEVLNIAARSWGYDLKGIQDIAIAVGGDTRLLGVTTSGAAEAMMELARAGVPVENALGNMNAYMNEGAELGGALGAAIRTASASELDMVKATELGVNILNIFKKEAEASGKSTDEWLVDSLDSLVRTADASVASVGELQRSFTNVGPTMAMMGYSLDEANTALAILSNNGIRGSEAGTALRSMLNNMIRDVPASRAAWEELGVSMYTATGEMRPLKDIIEDMRVGLSGMTQEQQNYIIKSIAGTYGQRAMNALLTEGAEGWDEMANAIANAAGTEEYAAARTQTLSGLWEAFQGKLEAIAISVGNEVIPSLGDLVSQITPMIDNMLPPLIALIQFLVPILMNWASAMADRLPGAIATVGGFITGTLIPGLQLLGGFIQGTVIPALGVLWGWLSTNIPAAIAILAGFWTNTLQPAIMQVWGVIQEQLLPALATLFGAIGGEGGTVMSMFSSYVTQYLIPAIQTFATFLSTVLIPGIANLANWLAVYLPPAIQAVANFWNNTLMPGLNAFVAFVNAYILPALAILAQNIGPILTASIQFLADVWNNVLMPAFNAFVAFIQANVMPLLIRFAEWFQAAWPQIAATFQTAWGYIQSAVQVAVDIIVNQVWPILQGAIERIQETMANTKVTWEQVWTAIQGVVQAVFLVIGAVIATAIGIIVGLLQGLAQGIAYASEFFTGFRDAIVGVFLAIVEFLTATFNFIVALFLGNGEAISQAWNDMGTGLVNIFTNTWDLIKNALGIALSFIVGLIEGFIDGIVSFFEMLREVLVGGSIIPDMVNAIVSWFQNMADWVVGLITNFVAAMTTLFANLVAWLQTAWQSWIAWFQNILSTLVAWFQTTWQNLVAWFTNLITTLINTLITAFTNFKNNLVNLITTLATALIQKFTQFVTNLIRLATQLFSQAKNLFTNLKNTLRQLMHEMIVGILQSFREFLTKAMEIARNIVSNVLSIFRGGDWKGVGKGMMEGIGKGIMDKARDLARKAADAVKSAIRSAKKAMGIGSPSRVAAQEVGIPIAQGMGKGVLAGVRGVEYDMRNAMGMLTGAMGRAADGFAMAAGGARGGGTTIEIKGDIILPGVSDGKSLVRELQELARRR